MLYGAVGITEQCCKGLALSPSILKGGGGVMHPQQCVRVCVYGGGGQAVICKVGGCNTGLMLITLCCPVLCCWHHWPML